MSGLRLTLLELPDTIARGEGRCFTAFEILGLVPVLQPMI